MNPSFLPRLHSPEMEYVVLCLYCVGRLYFTATNSVILFFRYVRYVDNLNSHETKNVMLFFQSAVPFVLHKRPTPAMLEVSGKLFSGLVPF